MNKYLLLKGCAGLGNRLITLTKSIEYCEKYNRTLIVDWNDGLYFSEGYNFFNDYFELIDFKYTAPHTKELLEQKELKENKYLYPSRFKTNIGANLYDLYVQVYNPLFLKVFDKFKYLCPAKMAGIWIEKENYQSSAKVSFLKYLKLMMNKNSFPLGGNYRKDYTEDILIYADYRPEFNVSLFRKKFRIKNSTIDIINRYIPNINISQCVGIHVRATDMKPTREITTIINKLKSDFTGQKVFLATDNNSVIQTFIENDIDVVTIQKDFTSSDNIGLHQVFSKNDNFEGAKKSFEDGIADMVLLSQTKYLFYQGNSSFSILAASMRKDSESEIDWLNI